MRLDRKVRIYRLKETEEGEQSKVYLTECPLLAQFRDLSIKEREIRNAASPVSTCRFTMNRRECSSDCYVEMATSEGIKNFSVSAIDYFDDKRRTMMVLTCARVADPTAS